MQVAESSREQKVQEFLSKGYDRLQAENLADGRPEWSSRRVDENLNDLPNTKKQVEANTTANAEAAKKQDRRPTLSELEDQLRNIEENVELKESQREECEDNIAALERQKKAALEILMEVEGQVGIQARADRRLAQETLDKVNPRLEVERSKLDRIVGILKLWKLKLKDFPVAELKRRQVEQNRRDRLRGPRPRGRVLHF